MTRRVLSGGILGALAILGCDAAPGEDAGVGSDPQSAAPAPTPTGQTPLEVETRRLVSADSLLAAGQAPRTIAGLHALVDSAGDPDVRVPALFRLGLLELRLYAWEQPESVRAARPEEFWFNEIAGSWLYQGTELKELVRLYPGHPLADDAAYAATGLPLGGECEGWVPCYLYAATGRLVDFLDDHPTSEHAPAAVAEVVEGFRTVLADRADLAVATDLYDPVEVRERLAGWERVARGLREPERSAALDAIAELWERFGEPARAEAARGGG